MTTPASFAPASWLRELARLGAPRWEWGRAIRASASLFVPMALGLATGQVAASLWIAFGALTTAMGEGEGGYRSRLRQIAISSAIGALGFFAGYLDVLPYPVTIAVMTAAAFLCGIVNAAGAAYSLGSMLALLYAAAAIGLPQIAPFWQPALYMLVGVGFYALMLGLEAALDRRRPERAQLGALVEALAALARVRAAAPAGDAESEAMTAARRAVVDRSRAAYAALIADRRGGRTREILEHADFLDAADLLFAALMAETDAARLSAAAGWLDALGRSVARRGAAAPPAAPTPGPEARPSPLAAALAAFAAAAARDAVVRRDGGRPPPEPRRRRGRPSLPRLVVGPTVLRRSAALALCIGLGYAARYVLHEDHWYWAPLTVAMVMKPEFGSVFVRAVLRAAGTALGVLVGAAVLALVPKGFALVVALAAIAAFLPLAKSVSYGVQTLALTPLVLIVLDLIAPGTGTVDYGEQRLVATLAGGAIVLVFGYYVWPRGHARELAAQLDAALAGAADYLLAAYGTDRARTLAAERAAYARLSDLRAALGQSMAEPPPAGREAAAWFPLVAAAERVCDRIAAAAAAGAAGSPAEAAAVAAEVRGLVAAATGGPPAPPPGALADPMLAAVSAEAEALARRLGETLAAAAPAAKGAA